ncbi:MAG: YraN family protein [Gammaproteobacteria bacterium]|nr:MAG: YraN family protein [Gammaproteobacteria bacterium]RKZ71890.1 MAG: YraN family protein [Gammaproteobacteria bacterium]
MPGNSGKNSYQRGRWAEQTALEYLSARKLKLLSKNFRSAFGEIDLIMQDENIILFVEVRYRSSNHFHTALESINRKKCDRIIATSHQYLTENRGASQLDCRFDVVALSGPQETPTIEWIKNAFQA